MCQQKFCEKVGSFEVLFDTLVQEYTKNSSNVSLVDYVMLILRLFWRTWWNTSGYFAQVVVAQGIIRQFYLFLLLVRLRVSQRDVMGSIPA